MDDKNIDIHSVGGLVFNDNNELLVQYHNKYSCWTIPMGKVEGNCSITENLLKEFKEELDIAVEECEEIASKEFIYDNINPKDWTFIDDGKTFVVLFHLFKINKWSGELKNNEPQKHSELLFVPLDKLRTLQPVSDALKVFFEYMEYSSYVVSTGEKIHEITSKDRNHR